MRNLCTRSWKALLMLFVSISVSWNVFAQDRKVTGKITDTENGSGIPGVTVLVKGSATGSNSDGNGNYSISVPSNATLVFSFVGYTTQEVAVGNRTSINIGMGADARALQEVVVTGYAAQNRRDITGAVAVVDVKEMKKIPASNIADQLQGRIAGVQVSSSGDPGSAAFVRIRGIGSINQNEPLYIIDGVPVQNESNLNFLNPNDVESIQVLKDAASASIYGSRAANGVIVITTKKGKAGASKIEVTMFTGIQTPGKGYNMANPDELLLINQGLSAGAGVPFESKHFINSGGKWSLPDFTVRSGDFRGGVVAGDPKADPNKYFLNSDPTADANANYLIQGVNKAGTDWFKEVFQPAPVTNVQINASGGSERGNYFFSTNYYKQNGIMIKNNFTRYQARINSVFNVKKAIRIGEEMSIAYQSTIAGMGNPNEGSALKNSYSMIPFAPVYDLGGYWAGAPYGNSGNPVAQQNRSAESTGYSLRMTGGIYAEVDILKNLTARTKFGLDFGTGQGRGYGYRNFESNEINSSNGMSRNMYSNRNWVWSNTLNYRLELGDHKITALVGTEARRNTYDGFNANGNGLTFGDDPNYRILTNTNSKTWNLGEYRGQNTISSIFGQVNYNYQDKYLVSGTVRRDGVSRFINNPYGVFPAGSIGWRISKEEFMKTVSAINDLKLRVSYGKVGNNEIGDYAGFSNFGQDLSNTAYPIQGSATAVTPGFTQTSQGNPDLKWETTKMLNIGLDARILNMFDLTVEWYDRKTSDILFAVPPPSTAGNIGSKPQNIGDMRNVGMDFSLGYRGKALNNALNFGVTFNAGTYKNEMVRIDANSNTFIASSGGRVGNATRTLVGYPISQFWGYVSDGIIQKGDATYLKDMGDAKVGRMKFRDINGDGKIDDQDEGIIGSPIPKLNYGINLTANYKNFDFTFYVQGVYGNQIFNYLRYYTDFPAFQANYTKNMLYEAGKTYPALDRNDSYSAQRSTFYVENGSYFRGKNLTLGYTLPTSITSKIGVDRVRLYIQGQNLFTFTKYTGLDPDVTISNLQEGYNSDKRDLSMGVDYGRYPISRQVYIGLNVEF